MALRWKVRQERGGVEDPERVAGRIVADEKSRKAHAGRRMGEPPLGHDPLWYPDSRERQLRAALVARARAGDPEATRELWHRWRVRLVQGLVWVLWVPFLLLLSGCGTDETKPTVSLTSICPRQTPSNNNTSITINCDNTEAAP